MKKVQGKKAIFLDRDGTIIRQVPDEFLIRPEQLQLLKGAPEAIKAFNQLGFLVVIITNQPVISRGLITPQDMRKLHAALVINLSAKGARVDAVYFCPHHPDSKIKKWGIVCACRKPESGMILEAIKDFNINPKKSFMIGDALIDVLAGQRTGLATILVKTGPGHPRLDNIYKDTKPDFVIKDLKAAVRIVKHK